MDNPSPGQNPATKKKNSPLDHLRGHGDIGLAVGVMAILVVLILPMPAMMLDVLLAISITFSVLIIMTAIFIHTPLEFSAFPTVLLIATMMRLALNLASTRLILSRGHEGTDAAGQVIEAFGSFVMQGNFVIGIIIFAILVLVNFVVITKGSGRIAEVAARFTLDAMPGKQMAIDADLSAGLIDEKQARERRTKLESESAFFGAMDGASKFVRGDAVAGLLITFINIIGGIIIGVGQNGMTMTNAAQTYTLLTIGDGLVSQIPALIVSTAAGLLVSKAGVDGAANTALATQFTGYPKAMGLSSAVMGFMAVLPGIPFIPFTALAVGAGALAYISAKSKEERKAEERAEELAQTIAQQKGEPPPPEAAPSQSLKMDILKLEIGYGLINLIREGESTGEDDTGKLADQIQALRHQMARELGFVMPAVRIVDNVRHQPNDYHIFIKEIEAGNGQLQPGHFLAMNPQGNKIDISGIETIEPTFGLQAKWIPKSLVQEAQLKGYTAVDPITVIATHLTELIKQYMPELLTYSQVSDLLDNLPDSHKKLMEDLIPAQITITALQRVLQGLLAERISIRDLPGILEAVAEVAPLNLTTEQMIEHVRARLARQITSQYANQDGVLPMITLHNSWETALLEHRVNQDGQIQFALPPSYLQILAHNARAALNEAAGQGEIGVLVTSPGVRAYIQSIFKRARLDMAVIASSEIHPMAKIRTICEVAPIENGQIKQDVA